MPALDLMPFGVRCAPWGEWLQEPVRVTMRHVGAKMQSSAHGL